MKSRLFDEVWLGLRLLTLGGWVPPVEAVRHERIQLPQQETQGTKQEWAREKNGKPISDMDRVVDASSCPDAVERYQELWVDLGGES
jgi:hypothetical protein